MSRRRGIMSDSLKLELAKELGVFETVQREGFGGVSSRNCGNMVKKAIELAERSLAAGTKGSPLQ
jgi:small acid-soluble spore protein F (minor alpha/beta-type SASP)